MSLIMVYALATPFLREDAVIDLVSNADRFHAFFLGTGNNDKFLKYSSIRFRAQAGYTAPDMLTADYLDASIGVPVFSQRFREALGELVAADVQLVPCEVLCGSEVFTFYVGRIITYLPFVDEAASSYRQLTDGRKILQRPHYKTDIATDFYLARDVAFPHLFVASEKLAALITDRNLAINTRPLV